MHRVLFIVFVTSSLVGCGPAGPGPSDIRLKRPVTTNEVVGVWKLRDDCVAWLAQGGDYKSPSGAIHEIEIRPDGTCRFRSILQMPARYVECDGTWELELGKRGFTSLDLSLDVGGGYAYQLDFTELFGAVELFEYWGDPDACELLRFEKQGEPYGPANGSQPFRSETNATSSAAGSRR